MASYNRSGLDYFSYGGTVITWKHGYHQMPFLELNGLCRVYQKGTQYYGNEVYISNMHSSMLGEQFLSQEENTLLEKKKITSTKAAKKGQFWRDCFLCVILLLLLTILTSNEL